ncbi:MAG: hypothetical protein WDN04_09770 [Rhodospirillales bacterium]
MTRPAKGPAVAQTTRLLDVIARSNEAAWLTTCRDHNRTIRNDVVAQAANARLAELNGAVPKVAGDAKVRMTAIEQAQAMWVVLAKRATDTGSTTVAKITYGDLAVAIGYPHKGAARAIKPALSLIGQYCVKHNMPALNALAVNQASMEVGDAVVVNDGTTPREERANIVAFDWNAVEVPSAVALHAFKAAR